MEIKQTLAPPLMNFSIGTTFPKAEKASPTPKAEKASPTQRRKQKTENLSKVYESEPSVARTNACPAVDEFFNWHNLSKGGESVPDAA